MAVTGGTDDRSDGILYLMVTCSMDPSRATMARQVVNNLVEQNKETECFSNDTWGGILSLSILSSLTWCIVTCTDYPIARGFCAPTRTSGLFGRRSSLCAGAGFTTRECGSCHLCAAIHGLSCTMPLPGPRPNLKRQTGMP